MRTCSNRKLQDTLGSESVFAYRSWY